MDTTEFSNKKMPLSAVVMASGHATRFKGDKLLAPVNGVPMIERLFIAMPKGVFDRVAVVSRDNRILDIAVKYGFTPVFNDDKTNDTAITIRLGMENILPDSRGCAFFVGDQPWLKGSTILRLAELFISETDKICIPVSGGKRGNPVFFPEETFEALKNLHVNEQGKAVIKKYPHLVVTQEVDESDLRDVDYASDLNIL